MILPSSQSSSGVSRMPSPQRLGEQSVRHAALGTFAFKEPSSQSSPGSTLALPQKVGSSAICSGRRQFPSMHFSPVPQVQDGGMGGVISVAPATTVDGSSLQTKQGCSPLSMQERFCCAQNPAPPVAHPFPVHAVSLAMLEPYCVVHVKQGLAAVVLQLRFCAVQKTSPPS